MANTWKRKWWNFRRLMPSENEDLVYLHFSRGTWPEWKCFSAPFAGDVWSWASQWSLPTEWLLVVKQGKTFKLSQWLPIYLIVYSAQRCMCLIGEQSCFKERGRRQTRKLKSLTFWRRRWAPQKYWQKNPAVPGRLQSGRQGAGCCPEDGGGGRPRQWERLGHQVW